MSELNSATEAGRVDDAISVIPDLIEPGANGAAASSHPPPPPRLRARAASHERRPLTVNVATPEVARDLMSRELLTIGPDDVLESLEEHMQAFQFRHLPVVEGDVLVGLISHSDLLHAFSSKLSKSAPEENVIIRSLPAKMIMRKDVVTVRPTEPLANVAALFWQSRVGCLPVTEADGKLVGIITEGDFIRLAHHFLVRGPEDQKSPQGDEGDEATEFPEGNTAATFPEGNTQAAAAYRDTLPGVTQDQELQDTFAPV